MYTFRTDGSTPDKRKYDIRYLAAKRRNQKLLSDWRGPDITRCWETVSMIGIDRVVATLKIIRGDRGYAP